jgi:hypothetical protein
VICLENPTLDGGSTIAIVEAKTTQARVYEFTLTVEPIWAGTQFKSEPSPGRFYKKKFHSKSDRISKFL